MKKNWKLIALLVSICQGMLTLREGYDNLTWNKRMEERLLTVIPRVSPLDCAEECLSRTGCLSFNYLRSAIFCELNYATDISLHEHEIHVPTDSVGWIYGRREHWSMLLTKRCQDSNCSLVEKCVESLDGRDCVSSQCHPSYLKLPPNTKPFKSKLSLDFGSTHSVVCADGYLPFGDGIVKCLWNASWTNVNLECRDPCPGSIERYENSNYCFMPNKTNWASAKANCSSYGGHLLEIETEEENEWINSNLNGPTQRDWWTGGTDETEEDEWKWDSSGRFLNYSNWQPGEPRGNRSENCLVLVSSSGKWHDYPCSVSHAFVCEREIV